MLSLNIALIVISVALVGAILLQSRSAGLGAAFGGGGGGMHIRRGSEKRLYQATIVLAIVFIGLAIAHLYI